MNCKISYSSTFARSLKRLSKHYKSIKSDYLTFQRADEIELLLLDIYDKSERETLKDNKLDDLMRRNGLI